MQDQSMPWIEKYRPTHFDNIVLDPLNREFFQNIIKKRHFPNLLFYGPPGTGKTTTIINLIQEYQAKYTRVNKETIIHLNASDERGVDVIRTQIYNFVRSCHIFETGCKFVILDEVDYMTKNAQQALKTLLQTCHHNVRFCLICNYISKIDQSLQREFICVRFNQLPPNEIRQFINRIADSENLSIKQDDIDLLMASHQSDIRSMVNFMQSAYFESNSKMIPIKPISSQEWMDLTNVLRKHTNDIGFTEENSKSERCDSPDVGSFVGEWSIPEQRMRVGIDHAGASAHSHIEKLSLLHNLNKKQILLGYMNYILRKYSHLITPASISVFENVAHASDDMPCDDLVLYFVTNISKTYANGLTSCS